MRTLNLEMMVCSPILVRSCIFISCRILCIIFNKSVCSGIFSHKWKIRLICPIHEGENAYNIEKYSSESRLSFTDYITKPTLLDCHTVFWPDLISSTDLSTGRLTIVISSIEQNIIDTTYDVDSYAQLLAF